MAAQPKKCPLVLALRRFPPEKPGFGTLLTGAAVAAALGNLPLERFFPGVAVCAAVELVLCSRGQPGAALACSGMLGAALCAATKAGRRPCRRRPVGG